jgi:hypothetical protein
VVGQICQAGIEACRDSWYDDFNIDRIVKRNERGAVDMSEYYRVVKLLKTHLYTKFNRR